MRRKAEAARQEALRKKAEEDAFLDEVKEQAGEPEEEDKKDDNHSFDNDEGDARSRSPSPAPVERPLPPPAPIEEGKKKASGKRKAWMEEESEDGDVTLEDIEKWRESEKQRE